MILKNKIKYMAFPGEDFKLSIESNFTNHFENNPNDVLAIDNS